MGILDRHLACLWLALVYVFSNGGLRYCSPPFSLGEPETLEAFSHGGCGGKSLHWPL